MWVIIISPYLRHGVDMEFSIKKIIVPSAGIEPTSYP